MRADTERSGFPVCCRKSNGSHGFLVVGTVLLKTLLSNRKIRNESDIKDGLDITVIASI